MTQARRLVGDAIREARRARGWSQLQLAREAGTDQHHISRIESGSTGARLDTLARLLAVLGLNLHVSNDIESLTPAA